MKEYILIPSLDKVDLLSDKNIIYCKSDGRYTSFFTVDGKKIIACKNLGEYDGILNPEKFFRIHQSYIVNINYIRQIKKRDGIICVMDNGEELPVAVRKQAGFYNFIGLK